MSGAAAVVAGGIAIANSIVAGNRVDARSAAVVEADVAPSAVVNGGGNVLSAHAAAVDGDGVAVDAAALAKLPPDGFDLDGDQDTAEPLPVDARGEDRATALSAGGADGAVPDADAVELAPRSLIVAPGTGGSDDGGTLAEETADGDGLALREALALTNGTPGADTITIASRLTFVDVNFPRRSTTTSRSSARPPPASARPTSSRCRRTASSSSKAATSLWRDST